MFAEFSLFNFIKDVYPVSTIAMFLILSGYVKGYIIFKAHTRSLEKRLEKIH